MNITKPMLSKIGSIVLVLALALVGYEAYNAYMINHTYYYQMLQDSNNWKLIIWFLVLTAIPLGIATISKKFNIRHIGRGVLGSIIISGFIHTSVKGGLVGSTGSFIFFFNTVVLLSLIIIFFGGIYALGTQIYSCFLKKDVAEWTDMLLALGFGIGAFLFLNYLLLVFQLFYPLLARLQFFGLGYMIWKYKKAFANASTIINNIGNNFKKLDSSTQWVYIILIAITLIYVMFSFNLAFIPYSTAWDANHAYMYFPKIWAVNNGVFFSEGPISGPYIWMVYISYWFSLFQPLTSFTLSPDTVAVVMNNVSGWLSLLFGLGAIHQVIHFFKTRDNHDESFFHTALSIGWTYLLLWLMSGMGAFLVFVDNKTDLGVMSLTMLAIMTGFMFVGYVGDINKTKHTKTDIANYTIYAIISGIFFALAIMAKPTAFQDALIFGLFLVGFWVGSLGLLGGFLLVLGILGRAETMSIVFYINKSLATKLGISGLIATLTQGAITLKSQSLQRAKPLGIWIATMLSILIVAKGGYILTQQIISDTVDVKGLMKGILLGQVDTKKEQEKEKQPLKHALVADSGNSITIASLSGTNTTTLPSIKPEACTLPQAGLTKETLYTGLGAIQGGGLVEDLGRYIGFGQRTFSDPKSRSAQEKSQYSFVRVGYPLLKLFFHTPGCYSFNTVADILCEDPTLTTTKQGLESILPKLEADSNQYKFLSGIIAQYQNIENEQDDNRKESIQKDITKSLTDYVQGNVVQVAKDKNGYTDIAVPYAYLTPLNVVFNRSLQNLSSYYTDIGFIWILSFILLIAGTIYAITKQDKKLLTLHLATICGWIIWWFIASGIIWYAVGIIAWTTFCNALYISHMTHNKTDNIGTRTVRIMIGVIIFASVIQTGLNLFRIASQGGSGPFTWYKGATGKETAFVFTAQGIQQKEVTINNYRATDVFDLQFGHYNYFMDYVANRNDEDGVLIAGTYLQYFLKNQNNITSDGLLTEFWKWGSDENTCNLSLRLQDKKIKYLVIDPNIGSVVMGGGNASLFDRFVAKIDSKTNKIITHGTMTMLAKMIQDNYLKLVMTNNMGAKYAYTLTDKELVDSFEMISDQTAKSYLINAFNNEPLLFRSKLAVPRFFGDEAPYYYTLIGAIFQQRLTQPNGIEDLANILGKTINLESTSKALSLVNNPTQNTSLTSLNKQLTDDEKTVVGYYTAIKSKQKANDSKGVQEIITSLLQSSLAGGSQLMTFELQI